MVFRSCSGVVNNRLRSAERRVSRDVWEKDEKTGPCVHQLSFKHKDLVSGEVCPQDFGHLLLLGLDLVTKSPKAITLNRV